MIKCISFFTGDSCLDQLGFLGEKFGSSRFGKEGLSDVKLWRFANAFSIVCFNIFRKSYQHHPAICTSTLYFFPLTVTSPRFRKFRCYRCHIRFTDSNSNDPDALRHPTTNPDSITHKTQYNEKNVNTTSKPRHLYPGGEAAKKKVPSSSPVWNPAVLSFSTFTHRTSFLCQVLLHGTRRQRCCS